MPTSMPKSKANIPEQSYTIIVVEDDEGLNYLIRKKLKEVGYKTKGTTNGIDALQLIQCDPMEIILLDYQLPDGTGEEIMLKIIKQTKIVPNFIVMTGYGDEKIAVKMMKLGAIDYLVKDTGFLNILISKIKKTCNDLTNAKRLNLAEENLEKSNLLLHETSVLARAGGWEFNIQTHDFIWTSTTQMIFEVDKSFSPTLDNITTFFCTKSEEEIKAIFINAINNCNEFDFETEIISARGHRIWVRIIGKIKELNQECIKLYGIIQDISQQKKIQFEQILREKHLQSLLQNPEGYIIYRTRANLDQTAIEVIHVSPSFTKLLGIPEDDKHNFSRWFTYVHPDDIEKLMKANARGMQPPFVFTEQIRYVHPEKGVRWLDVRARGIPFDAHPDRIEYANGIILDITNQKQTEEKLKFALDKAQESDRLKSAFLANMSHEIRTPMNGILGFLKLLNAPYLSETKRHQYTEVIKKSSERLLGTLNDLIDISKIESGQITITETRFSLQELGKDLYDFFYPEAIAKNLEFRVSFNIAKDKNQITTDHDKLFTVISNLIKNAIKFTHTGVIELNFSLPNDDDFRICVSDTGIGIPQNRIEAIFNRFEQADIEDKEVFEGSGLGLAISKAYIEQLGGSILVESEEGKGSTFCCRLPLKAKESSLRHKSPQLQGKTNKQITLEKAHILIVEDDDVSLTYLQEILSPIVKKIDSAKNGIDGINLMSKNPHIDIILMDLRMPGIDGLEASKRIRESNKDVIIIAQTAYALMGDREKSIAAGCNDYISKPIQKDKLIQILEKNLSVS